MNNNTNVLIVNDSKVLSDIFYYVLTDKGYRVHVAESVSSASMILGKENIATIILDYNLAGINTGKELIKKLKKYNISIKIYASSSSEERNRELIEIGCEDILKPEKTDIDRLFKDII